MAEQTATPQATSINTKKPIYKNWLFWVGVVAVVALVGVGAFMLSRPKVPQPSAEVQEQLKKVELQNELVQDDDGSMDYLKGKVKNNTNEEADIHVEYAIYNKKGENIGHAKLQFNNVKPGEFSEEDEGYVVSEDWVKNNDNMSEKDKTPVSYVPTAIEFLLNQ